MKLKKKIPINVSVFNDYMAIYYHKIK